MRTELYREEDVLVLELGSVVVQQNVPALDLLVLVLEAFVPVLQTLSFRLDAQLTPSYGPNEKCMSHMDHKRL